MKIEIELPDPKNCMGCLMLDFNHRTGWFACPLFCQEVSGFVDNTNNEEWEYPRHTITKEDVVRPQGCIEAFGE